MKIKTVESPQYGEYYCREVGRIDYAKLPEGWESWIKKFSPRDYFGSVMVCATPLSEERKQKGISQPTIVPLRRDNLEWAKNNACQYCAKSVSKGEVRVSDLTFDHVVPKSRGGQHHGRT